MIPLDLSANCDGWIYDPNGSGIQILGIRSREIHGHVCSSCSANGLKFMCFCVFYYYVTLWAWMVAINEYMVISFLMYCIRSLYRVSQNYPNI